jgi:SAM-dependent methyltransferase
VSDRSDFIRRAYEDDARARGYEAERSRNIGQRVRAQLERAMLRRALGAVERRPARDARVLDVACGTGRLAGFFAAEAARYTGLDFSRAMLAEARRARPALTWVQGDATRLPFADRSFDLVVTTRFLRHLDAPARAAVLAELARVSRGLVLVELLLGAGLVWAWKRLYHAKAWTAELSPRRPSHEQAVRELDGAGLRVRARHALFAGVSQPHVYVCSVAP